MTGPTVTRLPKRRELETEPTQTGVPVEEERAGEAPLRVHPVLRKQSRSQGPTTKEMK